MTDGSIVKPIARFSTSYTEPSKPVPDSRRARVRIQKHYDELAEQHPLRELGIIKTIARKVEQSCGVNLVAHNPSKSMFLDTEAKDFLDIITIVFTFLLERYYDRNNRKEFYYKKAWLTACRIVFSEENLAYTIGDDGVVRYAVDEEFARNETSAIAALSGRELSAVRHEAEQAFKAIHQTPPDTKDACKHIFEAVEILFRILFPDVRRLGSAEASAKLLPLLRGMYSNDTPASDAAANIVKEIGDWANWLHTYRHGQRVEEPTPPPLEVAVLGVSAGASYLRFLADVHGWQQAASASGTSA